MIIAIDTIVHPCYCGWWREEGYCPRCRNDRLLNLIITLQREVRPGVIRSQAFDPRGVVVSSSPPPDRMTRLREIRQARADNLANLRKKAHKKAENPW